MNLRWTLRILRGPMRPFLLRKLADRLREIGQRRRVRQALPTMPSEGRSLRLNLVPLPSSEWFAENGSSVVEFARRMHAGIVDAYGIDRWRVGLPDPEGVDVRSVHELSRMHHWCAYALAAHIDSEHRDLWCERLEREISAFVQAYPPGTGTHWAFPMGTGIRLHSMLVAWDWARRTGWRSVDGDRLVAATAIDHAMLTFAERESRGGLSTSHYAANLLGVLAASVYVHPHPDADRWRRVCVSEVQKEISRQILPDGMANEASTGYHRQVIDTFVHAMLLLSHAGEKALLGVPQRSQLLAGLARSRQLEAMGMPLVGDNDDGLAMKLTGFAPDLSYTYDVARRLFGADALSRATTDMESFGLGILEAGGLQCTLRNGPVGQFGKGGHAHSDQNSLTIRVHGRWFVVDSGSSTYTFDVERRNTERSATMHSTMWPTACHQAEHPPGETGLFWLLEDHLQRRLERTGERSIRGEVARPGVGRHIRLLELDQGALRGHDQFMDTGGGDADCVFVFHPNVYVDVATVNSVRLVSDGVTLVLSWQGAEGRREPATYSERFAEVAQTSCLRLRGKDISWTLHLERS